MSLRRTAPIERIASFFVLLLVTSPSPLAVAIALFDYELFFFFGFCFQSLDHPISFNEKGRYYTYSFFLSLTHSLKRTNYLDRCPATRKYHTLYFFDEKHGSSPLVPYHLLFLYGLESAMVGIEVSSATH